MNQASNGPAISCTGLKKTYRSWFGDNVDALKGLDLSVPRQTVYGLLGPNGAGKTTFVKCLLGLVRITGGSATLLGEDVPAREVRYRVGYLPEGHQIPGHLKGRQALSYYGRLNGAGPEDISRRGEEFMERLEIKDWRNKKVKTYSKGMKQRLGIVQALIADPDILFLDEPTDGVDPMGRKTIRNLLEEMKDEGKTIFINSHILTELELICDRVAILKEGELVREGPLDELRETGVRYRFRIAGDLPDPVADRLERDGFDWQRTENGFEVELENEDEDLNNVQNILRKHEVNIREMTSVEEGLEDLFIDAVSEEENQEQ